MLSALNKISAVSSILSLEFLNIYKFYKTKIMHKASGSKARSHLIVTLLITNLKCLEF